MVECIVCLTEFSAEGPAIPYVLKCGHSLCAKCSSKTSLTLCPTCRAPILHMTKNFALIESITSSSKGKTEAVCSECNSSIAQKDRIRVCLPCSTNKDADWMKKPFATFRISEFYLCGFCVVDSHLVGHCVKKVSEVENFLHATRYRHFLEKDFAIFYKEFQELAQAADETLASFVKTMKVAISELEKNDSADIGTRTSAMIANGTGTTTSDLNQIVQSLREVKDKIKKTTAEIQYHLTSARRTSQLSPSLETLNQDLINALFK